MTVEKLYNAFESAFRKNDFNINGVWDQMTYSSKMLMCERMVESGSWKNLPEFVMEYLNKFEKVKDTELV